MKLHKLQHFLSIDQLNSPLLLKLLKRANDFSDVVESEAILNQLHGKTVAHLFFENSTRTRCSFELAATRLGANNLTPDIATSSVHKGESYLDMVLNLEAMGVRAFIVRHSQKMGIAELVSYVKPSTHLINAGDGSNEHPSQTLLDLLTIQQHQPQFEKLRIAIVGDIIHSRVAFSLLKALKLLNTHDIRLIGPEKLLPKEPLASNIKLFNSLEEGLAEADVIMTLRLQRERMGSTHLALLDHYAENYCLNSERLSYAKANAIVMHPGPINRDMEITSEVADGPQSVILKQVHNGVLARMAILDYLMN